MAAPSTATAAMPASTVPVQRPGEAFFEFVAHMTRESAAKKELIDALGGIGIAVTASGSPQRGSGPARRSGSHDPPLTGEKRRRGARGSYVQRGFYVLPTAARPRIAVGHLHRPQ